MEIGLHGRSPIVSGPLADFEKAYAERYGRRPRTELRQAVSDILRWLGQNALAHGDDRVMSTVPQMARALGWPTMGSAWRDDVRYRNQITRRLDILVELGWLRRWEALYTQSAPGRAAGILIVLSPAGVAQSVEATPPVAATGS
jgi:hypothetical protein